MSNKRDVIFDYGEIVLIDHPSIPPEGGSPVVIKIMADRQDERICGKDIVLLS